MIEADTVLGLGGHYVFVRPERDHLDALTRLVEDGQLTVEVAATYPLDRIAEAHRESESGHTSGKIVVLL